jgi:hypothetical protein
MSELEEPPAAAAPGQTARRPGNMFLLGALMSRLASLGSPGAPGRGGSGHRSITLRLGPARDEAALAHGSTSLSRAFMRSVSSFSGAPPPQDERGDAEAGAEAGAPDDEETAASAAERHRLSAATGVDLQALAVWVEKSCPFLVRARARRAGRRAAPPVARAACEPAAVCRRRLGRRRAGGAALRVCTKARRRCAPRRPPPPAERALPLVGGWQSRRGPRS